MHCLEPWFKRSGERLVFRGHVHLPVEESSQGREFYRKGGKIMEMHLIILLSHFYDSLLSVFPPRCQ